MVLCDGAGKAPKPRPSGRKGPRAETGEEEAKRGVEAEMDAIASEEYTPDEREIGKEVRSRTPQAGRQAGRAAALPRVGR